MLLNGKSYGGLRNFSRFGFFKELGYTWFMLDWHVGEAEWESGEVPPSSPMPRPRRGWRRPRWWLWAVGTVLVLVAGGLVLLRWKARQHLAQLRTDIQSTIDTERWALETGNRSLYRSLLDPAANPRWRERQAQRFARVRGQPPPSMTVVEAELQRPDLALAEVEVTPARGPSYRVTRAYRRVGGLWLETSSPGGRVWLGQMVRETENLRFIFHPQDAALVTAVMPEVQALYSQLLSDLLLSPPQGKRPLYVVHAVQPIYSELPNDPSYYDLSDLGAVSTETFQRRLGALLLERVMSLFRTQGGELSFLVQSVAEWEFARWLDLPIPGPQTATVSEMLISLPFLSLTDGTWQALRHPTARALMGQTLIDYVARTHGRDRLADIVRGAQHYDAWYPFVTRVLGVPFEAFDAGWRNHALHAFTRRRGTRLPKPPSGLSRLLVDEQRAVKLGRLDLYERLLAPHSPPAWREQQRRLFATYQHFRRRTNAPFRLRVEDVIVRGDDALLRVELHFPDPGSTPYEEVRTYHRLNGEWKWTSTPMSFWGLTYDEQTAHLRFRFNRQDAAVVRAEMASTEAFYQQVARDLARPIRGREKLIIDVIPGYRVLDWRGDRTAVQILSPTAGMIMTGLSRVNFYRLAAGMALTRRLLGPPPTPFAAAVYEAIARWETEQWAPVVPWTVPRQRALRKQVEAGTLPPLRVRPTPTERHVDPILGYLDDAVIAYLVETLGREILGRIADQAAQAPDWETLIAEGLGLPWEAFESGWQAYLARTTDGR